MINHDRGIKDDSSDINANKDRRLKGREIRKGVTADSDIGADVAFCFSYPDTLKCLQWTN